MPYLDLTSFKALTIMPADHADAIQLVAPGWIDSQLVYWSGWIDSRLRKRYAAPFESPYPEAVTGWLARLVTVRAYLKRGVDPNDPQFEEIRADAERAMTEIKEAADGDVGLFDLPLRADTTAAGISKGGPLGYSEASPYVWTDEQAATGRAEDSRRGGTFG